MNEMKINSIKTDTKIKVDLPKKKKIKAVENYFAILQNELNNHYGPNKVIKETLKAFNRGDFKNADEAQKQVEQTLIDFFMAYKDFLLEEYAKENTNLNDKETIVGNL